MDDIGPKVLKYCAITVYEPLPHLFMTSISQHKIPAEWKTHCVTPIHKAGDRAMVGINRSISLLCSTSKILECIIYNKCYDFLDLLLSLSQFGFRKNHSSFQQLLQIYCNVFEPNDSGLQSAVIFLDLAKAFAVLLTNNFC